MCVKHFKQHKASRGFSATSNFFAVHTMHLVLLRAAPMPNPPAMITYNRHQTINCSSGSAQSSLKGRLHMTIGMQTGMQTRCDDRFANRSACVNSQIHCFQTGRLSDRQESNMFDSCRSDRRPARCVNALAIGMTTGLQSIWPLVVWLYINGLDVTCWLY